MRQKCNFFSSSFTLTISLAKKMKPELNLTAANSVLLRMLGVTAHPMDVLRVTLCARACCAALRPWRAILVGQLM